MSKDLNHCTFTGRLGANPEVRYATSGDAIANFNLACGEQWKDKDGQKKEKTEWIRCVAYKKLGEIIGEFLQRGSRILIEGRFQTREWEDKEGIKRYTSEIVISNLIMLDGKAKSEGGPAGGGSDPIDDQDIPF